MIFNKEKTEAKKSRDIFESYRGSDRRIWAVNNADDDAFYNGAIFTSADAAALEGRNIPIPAHNPAKPLIEILISQLTANKPRFTATAREDSDISENHTVAALFEYIWDISRGNLRLKTAVRDYEKGGVGCLMAYIDPNADNGKGEIYVTDVDPRSVYLDPMSIMPDGSDSPHFIIMNQFAKRTIEIMYPDFDFNGATDTNEDYREKHERSEQNGQVVRARRFETFGDTEGRKVYDVLDRYTKFKEDYLQIYDTTTDFEREIPSEDYEDFASKIAIVSITDGVESYITKQAEVREIQKIIDAIGNTYMIGENGLPSPIEYDEVGQPLGKIVELSQVTYQDLIDKNVLKINAIKKDRIRRVLTIGDKEYRNYTMKISDYPAVTFMLHHNRNPYAYGDVRMTKSLVEQLGKTDSLIITHAINTANLKVFVPEGGTDKKDLANRWNKAGSQFFTYNADDNKGGIHIVAPPPLPNEFYALRQQYISDIQREIGAYAFQDGDVASAPATARGTLLMDEMGQRRSRSKREDIEEALNQLAKVVLQMIPLIYREKKIFRISEPNHQNYTINEYNGYEIVNDVSNWNYDVKVVSGSMLQANRWGEFDAYMEMWREGILTDKGVIIRASNIKNAEQIAENESTIAQLQGALMQAQEQIKNLQGDMQTYDRELRHKDRQVEKEKFKGELKSNQARLSSKIDLAAARMNDKVKQLNSSTQMDEQGV